VTFSDDVGNEESLTSGATAAVEPTPAPPPAPTNLTAVVENGNIVLNWSAPSDESVTSYQALRRRPHEGEETLLVHVENTGSTATTYTDTNVTSGVRYVYRVKAINAAGLSQWSNYARATP
jgi:titin